MERSPAGMADALVVASTLAISVQDYFLERGERGHGYIVFCCSPVGCLDSRKPPSPLDYIHVCC